MNDKLYSSMRKMTTGFCIGIMFTTFCILALRLTVFSEMAEPPLGGGTGKQNEQTAGGYQINSTIYFSNANAKGNVYITNLSEENLIKVTLYNRETGEAILSTGFIKPGASMNTAKLNPKGQKLRNNVYPCKAEVTAHNPTNHKTILGTTTSEVEVYIGVRPTVEEEDSAA